MANESNDGRLARHSGPNIITIGVGSAIGAATAGPLGLIIGGIVGSQFRLNDDVEPAQPDAVEKRQPNQQEAQLAQNSVVPAVEVASTDTREWPGAEAENIQVSVDEPGILNLGGHRNEVSDLKVSSSDSDGEFYRMASRAVASGPGMEIYFRTNSYDLEHHYAEQLKRMTEMLNHFPTIQISLSGYADPRGNMESNLLLSQRRLAIVRAEMVKAGIDPSRISSAAYGEKKTIASETERNAYMFDRRVKISLTINDIDYQHDHNRLLTATTDADNPSIPYEGI